MTVIDANVMQFPEYDESDPEQVAAAREAARIRERENQELVRQLCQSYEGRAFLDMLFRETAIEHSVFFAEQPMTTSYYEGRRTIGQWARQQVLTAAPETLNMIRREAVEREQRYAAAAGLTDTEE